MQCSGCTQRIQEKEAAITCTSKICKNTFHAACVNAEKLMTEEIKSWTCPDCIARTKKGGDNTHTPVRQASDNITYRRKIQQQQASAEGPTEVPADALQSLSTDVNFLRQSIAEFRTFITTRLDELDVKLTSYDQRIKSLETLEKENALLKVTIANMQQRINNEAQNQLRNELEIVGLEETPGENPYHLALTAAVKVGVELSDTDLNYVARVGPKNKSHENSNADSKGQLHRPLVVSFTRRVKRDEFLKQARIRRQIKSKDIVGQTEGPDRTVYVNERLTSEGRRLFRDSRLFATNHGYKYCWVNHGSIFLRKRDASTGSPAIRINGDDDLNRLLKPQESS